MPTKNMAFSVLPNIGGSTLFVIVINAQTPTNDEWALYVDALRKLSSLNNVKTLVITDGGGPNTGQRKEIIDLMKGRPTVTCIVSDSSMVRTFTVALSWFNPAIKSFPLDRVGGALEHLEVGPLWSGQTWKEIERLRREVGASQLVRSAMGQ